MKRVLVVIIFILLCAGLFFWPKSAKEPILTSEPEKSSGGGLQEEQAPAPDIADNPDEKIQADSSKSSSINKSTDEFDVKNDNSEN